MKLKCFSLRRQSLQGRPSSRWTAGTRVPELLDSSIADSSDCNITVTSLDSDTLRRVLYYLHHGDYEFRTKFEAVNYQITSKQPDAASASDLDEETAVHSGDVSLTDVLISQIDVHAAAHRLDIPALQLLSQQKFSARLKR